MITFWRALHVGQQLSWMCGASRKFLSVVFFIASYIDSIDNQFFYRDNIACRNMFGYTYASCCDRNGQSDGTSRACVWQIQRQSISDIYVTVSG